MNPHHWKMILPELFPNFPVAFYISQDVYIAYRAALYLPQLLCLSLPVKCMHDFVM